MLNFFIFVLSLLLVLACHFALTYSLADKLECRRAHWGIWIASALGLFGATAYYLAKLWQPKKLLKALARLNREMLTVSWILIVVAFLAFLLWTLWQKRSHLNRIFGFISYAGLLLALVPMITYLLPQLLLKTAEFVAFNENSIGTATLFRSGGYLLGLLIIVLFALNLIQIFKRLDIQSYGLFAGLFFLALVFDMSLRGISSAARLGLLSSRNSFIFNIMIFEDKSLPYTAGAYLLIILVTGLYLIATHWRVVGEFKTSALKRKQRWWLRNCRRWAVAAMTFALIVFVSVTWIFAYINKPVELAPAEGYLEDGEKIIIPLTQVEDGHLHRFAFDHDKHNIRFIVVRKPNSNAYGVGLDACDICGVAGYFERNDSVICKRCDVVMNKATIGFKGGCNPVPFPYVVKDGQIVILKDDLIKEEYRFPVGE